MQNEFNERRNPLRTLKRIQLSAFLLVLFLAIPAMAELPGLASWMQSLVDEGKVVGCSAQVTQGGETIFLEAFGDRTTGSEEDLSPDQIVRIYSMSKAITSTAIMQLVDQGKLGIDDPVAMYIPEFADMTVELGGRCCQTHANTPTYKKFYG